MPPGRRFGWAPLPCRGQALWMAEAGGRAGTVWPMLTRLDLRGVTDLDGALPRPEVAAEGPVAAVRTILSDVQSRGDEALRDLTARFDGVVLTDLTVPQEALDQALGSLEPAVREALEVAAANVASYHRAQLHHEVEHRRGGTVVRALRRPVRRAGCYVPGGRAAYPSTVLMTAVPARVAGVEQVVLCVPPERSTGRVNPVVLAAAAVAGVDSVHPVGGAQAIGAMAYGTASIEAVDVICGPGNVYVALAKREVAGVVGVPSAFAGPSEVVVIADDTAPPEFAAIDIIVQAEHGPDGLAWLITWSPQVADAVSDAVAKLVAEAPRRAEIESTLATAGYAVLVDGPEQALEVANRIAPEHLQLMTSHPESLLPLVNNAGAVFCGPWSPASLGDYVAGPSHVLPTDGTARFASALTVDDFQKHIHVVTADRNGFDELAPHVEALALAEGLDAHARSISLRRESSPT